MEKITALDEREIRHETNKLLCYLRMKKRTKIDEIKIGKTELKMLLMQLKILLLKNYCNHLIFIIRFIKSAKQP